MGWIALADQDGAQFDPRGLGMPTNAPDMVAQGRDALLARGSLVIETRLPGSVQPVPLILFGRGGDWPFRFSLLAIPGGGLSLTMDQGGEMLQRTITHSDLGGMDVLRMTYSWDAPRKWGFLALERADHQKVVLLHLQSPRPMRLSDARALLCEGQDRYLAPEVLFLALSSKMEPVGPIPTLHPDAPIATPRGYRRAGDLRRGDTVTSGSGAVVPVLHRLERTVPALGSFAPVRLRAPYFGLREDVCVAPAQRLVISGSEVDYLFGQEAVLFPARHLSGGVALARVACGPTITYTQLLLPAHETLNLGGTTAESLYIGRIRRNRALLAVSLLAGIDRQTLPDHGRSIYPVLRAFEAMVLADQRAA